MNAFEKYEEYCKLVLSSSRRMRGGLRILHQECGGGALVNPQTAHAPRTFTNPCCVLTRIHLMSRYLDTLPLRPTRVSHHCVLSGTRRLKHFMSTRIVHFHLYASSGAIRGAINREEGPPKSSDFPTGESDK